MRNELLGAGRLIVLIRNHLRICDIAEFVSSPVILTRGSVTTTGDTTDHGLGNAGRARWTKITMPMCCVSDAACRVLRDRRISIGTVAASIA